MSDNSLQQINITHRINMKSRYAFWNDGTLKIVGVNCSSDACFQKIAGLHDAARRIREMVAIGLVTHGVLRDEHGQHWNEKLEVVNENVG